MENQELKPCPFCGEIPNIIFRQTDYPVTAFSMEYVLSCYRCKIVFIEHVPGYEQFYPKEHENARKELIRRWNTRKDG